MIGKTSGKNLNLPWLATVATILQWIALILITLILVCPSPWQHNSISLFVISPQQQSNTASVNFGVSSQSSSTNIVPTMTANQSISTDPVVSTSSLPDRYPAIQTAAAQSGTNAKREPIEDVPIVQQPQAKEALPNSTFPSPLGGDMNVTAINTTQSPPNLLQLRIGVLGSCFRTKEGHESCTPAKLTASYQYKGLQQSLNTTSSAGINVQEILPDSMTFYATSLLLLIVLLLCVCFGTTIHIILFFRQDQQLQRSMSASQAITTFFKPTSKWQNMMTTISKCLSALIAVILVISSAIQKYRLNSVKNAFNSANPIANDSVILQADTGNGFGFAWVSSLLLLIAFWLQRTANRRENALQNARKELQKSLPHHLINNNDDANGKSANGQTTMIMSNLSRSATLPPYTPPPPMHGQSYTREHNYFPQDVKRANPVADFDTFAYGLPSLQKAYESVGRFNAAKSSPPFSTYQNEFGYKQQQQGALAGSPLRHTDIIPSLTSSSSSRLPLHQQPQIGHLTSLHYDQSSFGNNTYAHEHTYDHGEYSYNTEVLADEATLNTCDCSFGRNRLDCSYHSTSTGSRNRHSFQQLKRQNSNSTFGHHVHRIGGQRLHRLGGIHSNNNSTNGQEGKRSVSPVPSYWTSSSAPTCLPSTIITQQQEWGRQEKERERLYMAELRAQRAAMHSR